jgi:S-formylglutathione hydrolase FrmB
MHKRLEILGAKITYHEEEGYGHTWDFWDRDIRNILDWLCRDKNH